MTEIIEQTMETPRDLFALAVKNGLGANEISIIAATYERWENEQSRKAYHRAMVQCQTEMPPVVKDEKGDRGMSFASLEHIQEECRPIYMRHGFSVSIGEGDRQGDIICVVILVAHVDGHEKEFTRYGNIDDKGLKGNPMKTPLQGAQSAVSYLTRTGICGVFNIVIAKTDRDGSNTAFITPQQRDVLHGLIVQTNTDIDTFMKWGGVDELALFPAAKYQEALTLLRRKVKS